MNKGLKPTHLSHKDWDYNKNREALFGKTDIPQFPAFYNADQLGWLPNQNIAEETPIQHTAQPFGCTNFTQASLANNLIQVIKHDPDELEAITNANERGGSDLRTSLEACLPPKDTVLAIMKEKQRLGWFKAFYAVRASSLDMFDTIRLALMEGAGERRTVSVGTPWYSSFENVGEDGIIKELSGGYTWHNHEISGWLTINGVPRLISKSWQGNNYGDKGLVYFTREQINQLFATPGCAAYVPAARVADAARIDLGWFEYVLSIIRQFGKSWLRFTY